MKHMNRNAATTRLATAAMLTALSVVIGIICKNFLTFGIYYRFTLENLPIIICALLYGPIIAAVSGAAADIISCLMSVTPTVNPIITLGAIAVGMSAGIVSRYIIRKRGMTQIFFAELAGQLIGQVIIKSIAKILVFGMPWWGIFVGLAFSVAAGAVEVAVIYAVFLRLGLIVNGKKDAHPL